MKNKWVLFCKAIYIISQKEMIPKEEKKEKPLNKQISTGKCLRMCMLVCKIVIHGIEFRFASASNEFDFVLEDGNNVSSIVGDALLEILTDNMKDLIINSGWKWNPIHES